MYVFSKIMLYIPVNLMYTKREVPILCVFFFCVLYDITGKNINSIINSNGT